MMQKLMLLWIFAAVLFAQPAAPPAPAAGPGAAGLDLDRVLKQFDDLMWHFKLPSSKLGGPTNTFKYLHTPDLLLP